jgi:hypothetical protein
MAPRKKKTGGDANMQVEIPGGFRQSSLRNLREALNRGINACGSR